MSFQNGTLWKDTLDFPIHAHGGCLLQDPDNWYYWYGEDRRYGIYVSCYRSRDLKSWEFRNHILTVDSHCEPTRVRADMSLFHPLDSGKIDPALYVNTLAEHWGEQVMKVNIERPKVVYCEKTGKYVLWAHFENGFDYSRAACCVATCDTPDGDFTYHGSFNPFGEMSRDCTLFEDDGKMYFVSAGRDNADLHFYSLQDDYLNVSALVNRAFSNEFREAPALFRRDGRLYLLSSYCTGWAPNQGKWSSAESISGEWGRLSDFGDETTFRSQPAFVFQKDGKTYYMGDRWGKDGSEYFQSSYVLLEIQFRPDGTPYIEYSENAPF